MITFSTLPFVDSFFCCQCGLYKPLQKNGGTGYARDAHNFKICYQCCGENDYNDLTNAKPGDKFTLYLSRDKDGVNQVTNWPGTFVKKVHYVKISRHNIAKRRYDTWFMVAGKLFHGVVYGDNTQICHIKALKPKS